MPKKPPKYTLNVIINYPEYEIVDEVAFYSMETLHYYMRYIMNENKEATWFVFTVIP